MSLEEAEKKFDELLGQIEKSGGRDSMKAMAALLFTITPDSMKQVIAHKSVWKLLVDVKESQEERYKYTVEAFKKIVELDFDLDKYKQEIEAEELKFVCLNKKDDEVKSLDHCPRTE